MTYAPLSSPMLALTTLAIFLFIGAMDLLTLVRRGPAANAFPGGRARLAWAIALYAAGRATVFVVVMLLPMTFLLALGTAVGLPEVFGYVIIFIASAAGTIAGLRVGAAVEERLASPLLNDRATLMASAATRREAN